jgi:hypothetical protein
MDQNRFVIKLKFELSSKVQFAGYFKKKFQNYALNYSAMKLSISIFQQFPDQTNGEFLSVKILLIVGPNILDAALKNCVSKMEFTKRSNSRLRSNRNETQQQFYLKIVKQWISSTLKY